MKNNVKLSTSQVRTCKIPLELAEVTMDHLHDDSKTLRVCSLVCKDWLPRSRYHVFGTLKVQLRAQPLRRFTELISAPSCTFLSSVRRIEVDGDGNREAFAESDGEWNFIHELLITLSELTDLSGIRSLSVRNLDWTIHRKDECTSIISHLSRLTQLRRVELDQVIFHDLREVTRILHSFPSLSQLFARVRFLKYPEYVAANAKTLQFPQSLKVVELESEDGVSSWLSYFSAQQALAVHTLSLRNVLAEDLPYLQRALQALSSSLCHLSLSLSQDLCESISDSDLVEKVSLANQHELLSLSIDNIDLSARRGTQPLLRSILPRFLSTVSSNPTKGLALHFCMSAVTDLDLFNWDALDRVLSMNRLFPSHEVCVTSYDSRGVAGDASALQDSIHRRLPLLSSKGALKVRILLRSASRAQCRA